LPNVRKIMMTFIGARDAVFVVRSKRDHRPVHLQCAAPFDANYVYPIKMSIYLTHLNLGRCTGIKGQSFSRQQNLAGLIQKRQVQNPDEVTMLANRLPFLTTIFLRITKNPPPERTFSKRWLLLPQINHGGNPLSRQHSTRASHLITERIVSQARKLQKIDCCN